MLCNKSWIPVRSVDHYVFQHSYHCDLNILDGIELWGSQAERQDKEAVPWPERRGVAGGAELHQGLRDLHLQQARQEADDHGPLGHWWECNQYWLTLHRGHQIVMTGKCCEIEGKGLYKVGDIIDISEPNSCTRKTVKCGEQCISKHLSGNHNLSRADPSRQAPGDDQGGAGPVLRHPGHPPQPGHQAGQARQVRLAGVQVRHKEVRITGSWWSWCAGWQTQLRGSWWPGLSWSLRWRAATAAWWSLTSWSGMGRGTGTTGAMTCSATRAAWSDSAMTRWITDLR